MNVICYGDSNTYGYDPRSLFGDRYDSSCRWVDILASKTGWTIYNWGENGRKISKHTPIIPTDTDLFIIMLGTNNILCGDSPQDTTLKMEYFLSTLQISHNQIMLIAPPAITNGQWVQDNMLIDNSRILARYYDTLTKCMGIKFADAEKWGISISYDGVHFTAQGHKDFADGILNNLLSSFLNNDTLNKIGKCSKIR